MPKAGEESELGTFEFAALSPPTCHHRQLELKKYYTFKTVIESDPSLSLMPELIQALMTK